MTKAEIIEAALALSAEEQMEVGNLILQAAVPSPDWHLPLVEEALRNHQTNPGAARTWAEVKTELWPDL